MGHKNIKQIIEKMSKSYENKRWKIPWKMELNFKSYKTTKGGGGDQKSS